MPQDFTVTLSDNQMAILVPILQRKFPNDTNAERKVRVEKLMKNALRDKVEEVLDEQYAEDIAAEVVPIRQSRAAQIETIHQEWPDEFSDPVVEANPGNPGSDPPDHPNP